MMLRWNFIVAGVAWSIEERCIAHSELDREAGSNESIDENVDDETDVDSRDDWNIGIWSLTLKTRPAELQRSSEGTHQTALNREFQRADSSQRTTLKLRA